MWRIPPAAKLRQIVCGPSPPYDTVPSGKSICKSTRKSHGWHTPPRTRSFLHRRAPVARPRLRQRANTGRRAERWKKTNRGVLSRDDELLLRGFTVAVLTVSFCRISYATPTQYNNRCTREQEYLKYLQIRKKFRKLPTFGNISELPRPIIKKRTAENYLLPRHINYRNVEDYVYSIKSEKLNFIQKESLFYLRVAPLMQDAFPRPPPPLNKSDVEPDPSSSHKILATHSNIKLHSPDTF
ncbi:hypothetical protein PUN28_017099 [Cardiocondyla obscurior]|uniref:Uncharacterized protein n=1 Tax=Cardiocondyla obscurior TaxID=286306 RepID=A0AAW2EPK9_9HYME